MLATLSLITRAVDAGLLDLDQDTFLAPVTATVPMRFPMKGHVHAAVGTPMQDMFDVLDQATMAAPRSAEQGQGTRPHRDSGRSIGGHPPGNNK